MKWWIIFVSSFLIPSGNIAAQQVNAVALNTASLRGSSSAAPQPDSVAEKVRDYAGKGTWELGLGYAQIGFRSQLFNSTLSGVESTVGYYFRDHLAVVGKITSAWEIYSANDSDAKQVFYGAGLKHNWGDRELQPFVQGLLGGVHMFPQTAFKSNAFAVELGGGVEKKLRPGFWLRMECDYVRTQLYLAGQNNFQCVAGISHRL